MLEIIKEFRGLHIVRFLYNITTNTKPNIFNFIYLCKRCIAPPFLYTFKAQPTIFPNFPDPSGLVKFTFFITKIILPCEWEPNPSENRSL